MGPRFRIKNAPLEQQIRDSLEEVLRRPKEGPNLKTGAGKPNLSNMADFVPELAQVHEIIEYGAAIYERDDWKKSVDSKKVLIYTNAALRHLFQSINDDLDEDSGFDHLALCVCNLLFLMHIKRKEKEAIDETSNFNDGEGPSGGAVAAVLHSDSVGNDDGSVGVSIACDLQPTHVSDEPQPGRKRGQFSDESFREDATEMEKASSDISQVFVPSAGQGVVRLVGPTGEPIPSGEEAGVVTKAPADSESTTSGDRGETSGTLYGQWKRDGGGGEHWVRPKSPEQRKPKSGPLHPPVETYAAQLEKYQNSALEKE